MLSLFVAISVSLNARARLGTAVVRGLSRNAGAVMVVGAADIVGEVDNWRPEGGHGTGNRFMPLDTVRFPVAATPSPPPQHRARRRPHTTEQPFAWQVAMGPGPMLMAIAGLYPGLTAAELRAPQPLPFAPAGGWNYHRLLADGARPARPSAHHNSLPASPCSALSPSYLPPRLTSRRRLSLHAKTQRGSRPDSSHSRASAGVPTGFVALPGNELVAEHPDTVAVVCDGTSLGVEFADGASHERIDAAEIRFGGRTAASCAVLGPYP